MALSIDEITVIYTIHFSPKHKFVGDQLKLAQKMEAEGLLQLIGKKMYSVTKKGEDVYRKCNESE
jgi:hypothetical protein